MKYNRNEYVLVGFKTLSFARPNVKTQLLHLLHLKGNILLILGFQLVLFPLSGI